MAGKPPPLPPDARERRVHVRAELAVEVSFKSEHNFFTGFSRDISRGGLFVATRDVRQIGEKLRVKFTLPGTGVFDVEAEVRWSSGGGGGEQPGMGLQFLNLPKSAEDAIVAFVAQRQSILFDEV